MSGGHTGRACKGGEAEGGHVPLIGALLITQNRQAGLPLLFCEGKEDILKGRLTVLNRINHQSS